MNAKPKKLEVHHILTWVSATRLLLDSITPVTALSLAEHLCLHQTHHITFSSIWGRIVVKIVLKLSKQTSNAYFAHLQTQNCIGNRKRVCWMMDFKQSGVAKKETWPWAAELADEQRAATLHTQLVLQHKHCTSLYELREPPLQHTQWIFYKRPRMEPVCGCYGKTQNNRIGNPKPSLKSMKELSSYLLFN